MPERVTVPFGPWLPDLPDYDNPGLIDAKNVYRKNGAYHPIHEVSFPGGTQSYDLGVTPANVVDSISASNNTVEFYCFCVSDGSLTLYSKEVDDATVNSTGISQLTTEHCNFVNYNGDVYFFDHLGEQYKSVQGAAFTHVATTSLTSPTAAAVVGKFIMIGRRTQIQWSGFNAPEDWTTSQRTQSGEAALNEPELGFITAITGGRTNLIFQEQGVSRLEYVGGALVWRVTLISRRQGAIQGSPVDVGGMTYFLGASNTNANSSDVATGQISVYKTNGVEVVEIPGVSDWLTDNFRTGGDDTRRNGVYDRARNQIMWASNSGTGTHKFLCMNVSTEEFTYFEAAHQAIIPGPFHDTDNAGLIMVVSENPDGNMYQAPLAGDALEATLTTGHMGSKGERTDLNGVEVIYSGSGATAAVSAKERVSDATEFDAYTDEEISGIITKSYNGRATAISVRFPAATTWDDAAGAIAELVKGGTR